MYDALGYFKILDANISTPADLLKTKYRQKVKLWHPDINQDASAVDMFQKLAVAYDVLSNPKLKKIYVLLSMIYTKDDFPDVERLKTYTDAKGGETPFLRVFHILKFENGSFQNFDLIGTYEDSIEFFKKATFVNIKKALFRRGFIKTVKHNLNALKVDSKDNFKLLVHNAAAFYKEDKLSKAYLSALQALAFADKEKKPLLSAFIKSLQPAEDKMQTWDFKKLRQVQLAPFYKTLQITAAFCVGLFLVLFLRFYHFDLEQKNNYYRQFQIDDGVKMADDTVALKVFNIPVDKEDEEMLYHITSVQNIMYGPSEKYDILVKSKENQTVRVTGYTPEQEWFRVMLDNGEMGYIKGKYLKKGVGADIPLLSQIIKR